MEIIKLLKCENELLEALLLISKDSPIKWSLSNKIYFLNTRKNFVDRIAHLREKIKKESEKKSSKLSGKEKLVLNYLMKKRKYLVCSIMKENKGLINHLNEQVKPKKKVA